MISCQKSSICKQTPEILYKCYFQNCNFIVSLTVNGLASFYESCTSSTSFLQITEKINEKFNQINKSKNLKSRKPKGVICLHSS